MKKLFYLITCIFVLTHVDAERGMVLKDSIGEGIKFVSGLTWKQVLKRAKKENKYIFVDCYATWCGPCKSMDKEVFPQKTVGAFYNQHFISVKCQMDKTDKDEEVVKRWYVDADRIRLEYGMPVFPTFLYFSPEGKLVSRDAGYKKEEDFVALAKNSIDPQRDHRYLQYYSMLAEYLRGKKDYQTMPALIDTAERLGQDDILKDLVKEYKKYLEGLPPESLYTKEYVSFISSNIQSSKDLFFRLFYPDGKKVDSVMSKKGYAQLIVDEIILKEDIYPYLRLEGQAHNSDLSLFFVTYHPDWLQYVRNVTSKYNADFANRTVLRAEVKWYMDHHDYAECARYFTVLVNNYSMNNYTENLDGWLNSTVWHAVFQRSVDKEQIDAAIECMQDLVERQTARGKYAGFFIDTYANLLYKAGRLNEAMEKEEEAIRRAIEVKASEDLIDEFRDTLNRMREGKPTWPRYIDKKNFFGEGLI